MGGHAPPTPPLENHWFKILTFYNTQAFLSNSRFSFFSKIFHNAYLQKTEISIFVMKKNISLLFTINFYKIITKLETPHSGGIWYIGRQIENFRKSKICIFKFNYANRCFSTPAGNILGISPLFRLRKTELENDLICLI